MDITTPALCKFLPWDTDFFGVRIGRVVTEELNDGQMPEVNAWCRQNRIGCLYFLAKPDDISTLRCAEKHGFGFIDIRMTFELALSGSAPANSVGSSAIQLRLFQPGDLADLCDIARGAHTDTRFFLDTGFSRERAEDLYATWIRLETEGRAQAVWVAASEVNQAVGYISCHWDAASRVGQIGLVGVSSQVRRQGIGHRLVTVALNWFRAQGAERVTVVTQGNNPGAQRLYQRCNFISRDLKMWYHKWYSSAL